MASRTGHWQKGRGLNTTCTFQHLHFDLVLRLKSLSLEGRHYGKEQTWEGSSWSRLVLTTRMRLRFGIPGYWLLARCEMCLFRKGGGFAQGLSKRAFTKCSCAGVRPRVSPWVLYLWNCGDSVVGTSGARSWLSGQPGIGPSPLLGASVWQHPW